MNTTDFEKLVRPYLSPSGRYVNMPLILSKFKEDKDSKGIRYMLEENKLIYIPNGSMNQYFVFSDESDMYCWSSGLQEGHTDLDKLDTWKHLELATDWDSNYYWIHRKRPMSSMNNGLGWNIGSKSYYTLEIPSLTFINWVSRNPMEVKE